MPRPKRTDVIVLLLCLLFIAAPHTGGISVCFADDPGGNLNGPPLLLPNLDHTKFKLIPPLTVTLPYLLPPVYDLRTVGRAAPSRAILKCAGCWSSAATYVMESLMLPEAEWIFSEKHMQFSVTDTCHGGSDPWMAQGYLTAWRGPVAEEDYHPNSDLKIRERAHVQNTTYLPRRRHSLDNFWIKKWVYHNGAIYASAGSTLSHGDNEYHTYWSPTNQFVHAVAIVGWDDHFSKEKFTYTYQGVTYTPPGDGAFIARDNTGPYLWDDGFVYISYYDGTIGYNALVGFEVEPVTNYKRIYQHDPVGTATSVSRTRMPGYIPEIHGNLENIGANVFTAVDSELLAAIGIPVRPNNFNKKLDCRIEIHLDPGTNPVNPNGPALSFTTTIGPPKFSTPWLPYQTTGNDIGGYYTIPLPQKVKLEAGQKFSVIVSVTGENTTVGLPVEDKLTCSNCASLPGQSYFSADGINWFDLTEMLGRNIETDEFDMENAYGNLGIKAYSIEAFEQPSSFKKRRSFGLVQNTIEIVNENLRPMTIKPIINQRVAGRKRSKLSHIDHNRSIVPVTNAWITIDPLETVKIKVPYGFNKNAGKHAFKVLWRDWEGNIQRYRKIRLTDKLTLLPLQLVSTNPGANTVAPPELSIIRAGFSRNIKPGPGFAQIRLRSEGIAADISCSVSGKELYITPAGPLSTHQDGGKQWTVILPADGVTDIQGTTLGQATSWTFVVQGLN